MGSSLDQDPSSHFVYEDPTSNNFVVLQTKKQTNKLNMNMNLIPCWLRYIVINKITNAGLSSGILPHSSPSKLLVCTVSGCWFNSPENCVF